MEKILLISKALYYPLGAGSRIAQYYFLDGLKNDVEYVICTQLPDKSHIKNIAELQKLQPNLKIYYDIKNKREFKKIAKTFFGSIYNRYFKKIISDDFIINSSPDNRQDIQYVKLINDVIEKEDIKQVQFEFYHTLDLSYAIPQKIKKIFILHEMRYKRLLLGYDSSNLPISYKNLVLGKTEVVEKAFLKNMDIVVVFNEDDAEHIKDCCPKVVVSPFGIPDEIIYKTHTSTSFNSFFFVGPEYHNPNAVGLSWFLDTIFVPNIDKMPFPVVIIGIWSRKFREKYKAYPKIIFKGYQETIEPFFENSVLINPILTGSGIRTKVLHAFANKVPVLSTRFGAECCFMEDDCSHIVFFDSVDEFCSIVSNYSDKRWTQLAQAGFDYYDRKFNKQTLLEKRIKIYSESKI
ncbi:MAG: glycosyltransferase family 4 protein [Prevotella sp.]|jgi:hypothetical protein|nr:glycosyltransferase family 4 protein [Prevotella sp.]